MITLQFRKRGCSSSSPRSLTFAGINTLFLDLRLTLCFELGDQYIIAKSVLAIPHLDQVSAYLLSGNKLRIQDHLPRAPFFTVIE